MRYHNCSIFATVLLLLSEGAFAFESEIVIDRAPNGHLNRFQAIYGSYRDVINILAVLAQKRVEILSVPKRTININYVDIASDEALTTLLSSITLSVQIRDGIYFVSDADPGVAR